MKSALYRWMLLIVAREHIRETGRKASAHVHCTVHVRFSRGCSDDAPEIAVGFEVVSLAGSSAVTTIFPPRRQLNESPARRMTSHGSAVCVSQTTPRSQRTFIPKHADDAHMQSCAMATLWRMAGTVRLGPRNAK
jgi:hypothetical protein